MNDRELGRFLSHVHDWQRLVVPVFATGKLVGDECWLWAAGLNKDGYGIFSLGGTGGVGPKRGIRGVPIGAHRASYEHFIGPIPDGLHIDHFVCDRPPCVNPWHCRPSTPKDNVTRAGCLSSAALNRVKTHCPQGHPYNVANTYRDARGSRSCKICKAKRVLEFQRGNPPRGPRPDGVYVATHCKRGHLFDEANTYWYRGGRSCRACKRDKKRDRDRRSHE